MSESKFESMGEDVMAEIFLKVAVNLKSVVRLRCVSKSWRLLVNSHCLPRLTCNDALEFKGHLMKVDLGGRFKLRPPLLRYTAHRCQGDEHFCQAQEDGQGQLLEKLNRGLIFLDACNGLLLHCRDNNYSPQYRVSNLETNSWVVVNGPSDSLYNKTDYAALAYNPTESLISFKIIAFFNDHNCLRIYSSKTGKWSPDLSFEHLLPYEVVVDSCCWWLQQSVYLQGAIYRLPLSKYLLRFETDEDCGERERELAHAIPLPGRAGLYHPHLQIHVGINNGYLNLASFTSYTEGLKVWVLEEEVGTSNCSSYKWIPKHHISTLEMPGLVFEMPAAVTGPVALHPYQDAIVLVAFTSDDSFFCVTCCHLDRKLRTPNISNTHHAMHYQLHPDIRVRPYSFPIFSCAVPLVSHKSINLIGSSSPS